MKNRVLGIWLAVMLVLSVTLMGCGSEEVPEYSLTISSTEGGSVTTPGEGAFTYNEGEKVNLAAIPNEGYRFVNWTGDVGEIADAEDSTTTITMKSDRSITATFAVKQYTIVIHSTEGGSVTTPGENAYSYDKGEVVNLVAVADDGYVFINWTGIVSTIADVNAASTTITMNGGYSITANFAAAIRDWYDLDAVRDNLDGSYILMNDLDSISAGYVELASSAANQGKGWQPIAVFSGSFDAQGFEIADLFINRPDEDGVGLFGCVSGGVIKNVGVVNAETTGRFYVGSLAGDNDHSALSNSYSTGSVTGKWWIGGLAGRNDGAIIDCYSTSRVVGEGWTAGLVGGNSGTVSDSYSTGSVIGNGEIGGLLGWNVGTVSNSYSLATVTGGSVVGGLVGWQVGNVVNSYYGGSVTGEGSLGGLVGENHGGRVSNSHYSWDDVLINGKNVITIGALLKEDFDRWFANDKVLDVNERLSQEDGYYLISSVDDLKELLPFGQDGSLRFILKHDLDLSSQPNFYIPYLAGEFDGNGRRIANLSVGFDFISHVGLFGYLASGGVVARVSAENVNVVGYRTVGGLVGGNDGTVIDSYFTGEIAGHESVGGLVGETGWNGGTIRNSYYNYEEVLINGRNMISLGALSGEDFEQWLANDRFLDINDRLSQEDGYYLINDVGDLEELLAFGHNYTLKVRLTSDLDLATEPGFYVPYLAGEFDGDGHKIRNLTLDCGFMAQVGLFGYLASSGRVSGVGVENANIRGHEYIGGLVGWSDGTVSDCYSTGSVTVKWGPAAGLVGRNQGTVSDCSFIGTVTCSATSGNVGGLIGMNEGTVSDCYSKGIVDGGGPVGGFVGSNFGTVSNSYSTSSVAGRGDVGGLVGWNDGTVSNCYSTGMVICRWGPTGGLVGSTGWSRGAVSSSFWDSETSGQSTSDGGTGKTTAEMKSITTFSGAGWNITAVTNPAARNPSYIWNIVDGQTYPFLSWQA